MQKSCNDVIGEICNKIYQQNLAVTIAYDPNQRISVCVLLSKKCLPQPLGCTLRSVFYILCVSIAAWCSQLVFQNIGRVISQVLLQFFIISPARVCLQFTKLNDVESISQQNTLRSDADASPFFGL